MTMPVSDFEKSLDETNRKILRGLKNPYDIQLYLDSIPYIGEERDRTPLQVMQDRQCHCLDGGLLAALCLRRIGFRAHIIDLVPEAGMDDDHVLAIYQHNHKYGAVAKSNYVGLRYREPLYRSLRELVMSYFEVFFNIEGRKTMRGYTRPLNLDAFDRFEWETTSNGVERVVERLYRLKSIPVLTAEEAAALNAVDERSFKAGTLGTNPDGVYRPGQAH